MLVIQATYQTANARVLADATAIVDADIQRASVAVKTQAARVDSVVQSAEISRASGSMTSIPRLAIHRFNKLSGRSIS